MPLGCPNYGARVVVDDDGNVLVPFLVAGFVYADIHEAVKPFGAIRFDDVQRAVDASADGLPVNPHIFGNGTLWQGHGEPADREVEILCEATVGICPRYISHQHAMFGASNSVGYGFHFDDNALPVQTSPDTRCLALAVVSRASPVTDGAVVLMPQAWADGNSDAFRTVSVCISVHVFDDTVLDTE